MGTVLTGQPRTEGYIKYTKRTFEPLKSGGLILQPPAISTLQHLCVYHLSALTAEKDRNLYGYSVKSLL